MTVIPVAALFVWVVQLQLETNLPDEQSWSEKLCGEQVWYGVGVFGPGWEPAGKNLSEFQTNGQLLFFFLK